MNRHLDGVYFRINRNGKWRNICFSDLTTEEREQIATVQGKERPASWWQSLAYHLADTLKVIGDTFEIVGGEDDD